MNRQFEDLMYHAGLTASGCWDSMDDYDHKAIEKFAELIVQKCVGIVENLSPGYKDYRDQIEDAFRRDCVGEIERQFEIDPGWKKLEFPEI
jgi:hypothetical protein